MAAVTASRAWPRNLDAEASVLGGILLRNETLALVDGLEPGDFFDLKHQVVFSAMRQLQHASQPIDVVTLEIEIERQAKLDAIGGVAFLGELALRVPTPDNVAAYTHTVVDLAARRRHAIVASEQYERSFDLTDNTDELIADTAAKMHALEQRRAKMDAPIARSMLAVDVARRETPPIRSYATGILQLDALIGGGVSTRQLFTVIGPPGAGKSAWAIATSIHIAPTLPVLYASTELEQHELMARVAGNVLDRPWSAIVRGTVPIGWVLEALDGVRIRLLGCDALPRDGAMALALIEREARLCATEFGTPPLIVIDYLQDLARGAERDLRAQIGDLATNVRALAQRLDCPAIAVSSVSRAYYSARKASELRAADDPTIYLAAAKESGDVDYASAVVAFLDVVDAPSDGAERSVRIAVAKSRHGQAGFAGALFAPASGRWRSSPEVASALSGGGRVALDNRVADDEAKVLQVVERQHREGKRDLCTKSNLKVLGCGVGNDRVAPALERLVHDRKLVLVEIERVEGGKRQRRRVYDLVGSVAVAPLKLDLETSRNGLHSEVLQ